MLQKLKPFFQKMPLVPDSHQDPLGPRSHTPAPPVTHGSQTSRHLAFHKYQGAGNDFIMVDNTEGKLDYFCDDEQSVRRLCDRRFGVGADGLIQICKHPELMFEMKYYNCDGREGSLCGNGARCAVAFAKQLGLLHFNEAHFLAWDGPHFGLYDDVNDLVHVKMADVSDFTQHDEHNFLVNTGSPHHVAFLQTALEDLNLLSAARDIRYGDLYKDTEGGINVNFVQVDQEGTLHIRTYERGVEAETLACGTGSVAAVLAHAYRKSQPSTNHSPVSAKVSSVPARCHVRSCNIDPGQMVHTHVKARGGHLIVAYERAGGKGFRDVYLIGPAKYVFSGTYTVEAAAKESPW